MDLELIIVPQQGTVDYENGSIIITPLFISSVSNYDGSTQTQIRVTSIPDSLDVVPKRNQLLEIDTVNSTVQSQVDTVSVGNDSGNVRLYNNIVNTNFIELLRYGTF